MLFSAEARRNVCYYIRNVNGLNASHELIITLYIYFQEQNSFFKKYVNGSSGHFTIHPADWPEYLLAVDGRKLVIKVSAALKTSVRIASLM